MADDDSQQIASDGEPEKRADFSPPVPGDDWDRIVVPMLWITGAALVINSIAKRVLPGYPDPSIPLLVTALTYLRYRSKLVRRYSFAKRAGICLLMFVAGYAVGLALDLAISRLWPGW
ncbi:MAG: hypothetical protein AABO41_23775 [Acidobacteriota bacterium]